MGECYLFVCYSNKIRIEITDSEAKQTAVEQHTLQQNNIQRIFMVGYNNKEK
jgi:hypothetical protein